MSHTKPRYARYYYYYYYYSITQFIVDTYRFFGTDAYDHSKITVINLKIYTKRSPHGWPLQRNCPSADDGQHCHSHRINVIRSIMCSQNGMFWYQKLYLTGQWISTGVCVYYAHYDCYYSTESCKITEHRFFVSNR